MDPTFAERGAGRRAHAEPWAAQVEVLLRLLRHDHESAERWACARSERVGDLIDFASANRLSLVALAALRDSPLRHRVSAAQFAALESGASVRRERIDAVLATLGGLSRTFEAASQPYLLLKGPYLAARFFGDVYGREYADLDVLVPRRDRQRAFDALAAAGYARKSPAFLGEGLTCFFVHGFDFTGEGAKLDLHWSLYRHPSLRIDERSLWERRQRWEVGGRSYEVLSNEDEIVFAALSLLRDIERGRAKVRNVVDLLRIADVLEPDVDWPRFLRTCRAEGVHGPVVNVVGACLDAVAGGDLLPTLRRALASVASRRVPAMSAGPLLFRPTILGLGNKIWSARAHDASLASWLLWWTASLPFRLAVHGRRPRLAGASRRP